MAANFVANAWSALCHPMPLTHLLVLEAALIAVLLEPQRLMLLLLAVILLQVPITECHHASPVNNVFTIQADVTVVLSVWKWYHFRVLCDKAQLVMTVFRLCRYAPFPKTKMTKLLNDISDAKSLLAEGR